MFAFTYTSRVHQHDTIASSLSSSRTWLCDRLHSGTPAGRSTFSESSELSLAPRWPTGHPPPRPACTRARLWRLQYCQRCTAQAYHGVYHTLAPCSIVHCTVIRFHERQPQVFAARAEASVRVVTWHTIYISHATCCQARPGAHIRVSYLASSGP